MSVPTLTTEVMFTAPDWEDVSAWVRGATIRRGSTRQDGPLLRYDNGAALLRLDNRDRRFDPTNLAGPYVENLITPSGETGVRLFTATETQPVAQGWTVDVKSAVGVTASVRNVFAKKFTGTSTTITKPSGTASGDKLLMFQSADWGTTADLTTPTGGTAWTLLGTLSLGDDTLQTKVWYKVAGGAEPASYGLTQNSGADGCAVVVAIQNADAAAVPIMANSTQNDVAVVQTPSTTPAGANDLEVRYVAGANSAVSGVTWDGDPADGYTERADIQSSIWTTAALYTKSLSLGFISGSASRVTPMRPVRITATWNFEPTTNLIQNPSFESSLTGWSAGGAATIQRTTDISFSGGAAVQVIRDVTGPPFFIYGATCNGVDLTTSAGQTVTVSAWVYVPAASFPKITAYSIAATGVGSTFITGPPAADGWYRIGLTAVLSAPLDDIQFQIWTDDTHGDGQTVAYLDAVQAEVSPVATAYCDGTQPACSWTGTAHASSSTRPSTFTFPLFSGYVDQWDVDWTADVDSEVSVPCSDAFKVFGANNRSPVGAVGAGETTGGRVNRVLDSIGWPGGAARDVVSGNSTVQATTLEGDALSEMQLATDSEIGELYVNGAGTVVFRNRQAILTRPESTLIQARFGDGGTVLGEVSYDSVSLSNDDAQLINRVRATRAGGAEQLAEDAASVDEYFDHTFPTPSDLVLQTDAETLAWAQWVLYISKDPELRFPTLTIKPQKDESILFPLVLDFDMGHRILVRRRPVDDSGEADPVIERECFIRGIEYTIEQYDWTVTYTLQSAAKVGSFLTLDHPTLGKIGDNGLVF